MNLLATTKKSIKSIEPIFYVYLHRRADSGLPFYIGKGKSNRAYSKHSRSTYWKNVVNKHGLEIEIIFSELTEEDAFIEEIKLIEKYTRAGIELVNFTSGGEGNCSPRTEQWKANHSDKIKAAVKRGSYKGREGSKNAFYGKKHSEETKQKLRQKHLERLKNESEQRNP